MIRRLKTHSFGEPQPKLQFPTESRCLLLLNERKEEHKAMDGEGNETEVTVTSYEYDGTLMNVASATEEAALQSIKRIALKEIEAYDTSDAVNSFTLQGKQMWLKYEKRVGLTNSITTEKKAGREVTVLWHDGVRYELPVDAALQMLAALELYALECYNVTEAHKADIEALTTVEEVVAYDYESDYPEKLNF